MGNSIFIGSTNILTISPIIISAMLAALIITGKWQNEKILTYVLFVAGICAGIMSFNNNFELAMKIFTGALVIVTVYAIFRKRRGVAI